ncbi:hypothetical protein R5W23_001350 [Gemmata sp. JC673]|uniref:Uncharacterized protein n=1 Tax=Gemmata algarum TaxID=2975278 RepID=A0ABU5EXU4_9BACT|nr:hypothetical protein [Gemmata algarum]MDY3560125.1 hypothetical protein [Gemmata algarum]
MLTFDEAVAELVRRDPEAESHRGSSVTDPTNNQLACTAITG